MIGILLTASRTVTVRRDSSTCAVVLGRVVGDNDGFAGGRHPQIAGRCGHEVQRR
jgi:hypothetical protein